MLNQNHVKFNFLMPKSAFHANFFILSKYVIYVMRCAIWYHLHNLKNLKNTHGGVLL